MQSHTRLIAILLLAAPLLAAKDPDPLKETIKQVKAAVGKSDVAAAKAAFTRAEELRSKYDHKQFTPLVQAIAKGITNKDAQLALAAIETIGKLKNRGSGKLLGALLKPPGKGNEERLAIHLAAIHAAGSIHDPETLKTLEKLLTNPRADVASAAAEALAGYKALEPKPRFALMKRLVKVLAGIEKKVAKAKNVEAKEGPERVRATLIETLGKLADGASNDTSDAWAKWIKDEEKAAKQS